MTNKLDVRGLACPGPVIEAKKALEALNQGIVEVLVDNEVAVANLEKLAQGLGCPVKVKEGEAGVYCVTITKGEESLQETVPSPEGIVLFLGSAALGRGNKTLGKLLMKSYLYTLTESDPKPQTILMMNGGVKLAVEGSDCLKSLQALVDQGTEILVCGTCLDYFGLKEQLQVGKISNMYDLSEKMLQAQKLISFT